MRTAAVASAAACGWLLPLGTGALVFVVLAAVVALWMARPVDCPDCVAGMIAGHECASCDGTGLIVRPTDAGRIPHPRRFVPMTARRRRRDPHPVDRWILLGILALAVGIAVARLAG